MSGQQKFYKRSLFWVIFGIPNLLSICYFLLIASPQYVSEAHLVVFQADPGSNDKAVSLQLEQNAGGMSLEGDYLLKTYLASWDSFAQQDRKFLIDGWGSGDFVSRFGGLLGAFRTTRTALWRYYRSQVIASIDEQSAVLTLHVTGYDPVFVNKVANSALGAGGQAINTLNLQAFASYEKFFERQITKDQGKLRLDIAQLSAFQRSSRIVDPAVAYTAQLDLQNQLTNKLVALNAQVEMVQSSRPASDQLQNLIVQRQSLERQMRGAQGRSGATAGNLTSSTGTYTFLQSLIKNDQASLAADEDQLLHAHQTALQHQYFLEYIGYPTTPTDPTEPQRAYSMLIVLGVTFLLYCIIK